ncbi:MAG: DUF4157 domain-containing protein [Cyanobacteria bacterium P01_A01_bin.123]
MVYERKKRTHEQREQLPINTPQNNLFASPDLETDEADNSFSVDSSKPAPTLEMRWQQADKPFYNFGSPVPATTHAVQRQPSSPLVQAKLNVGPAGDKYEQEADQVASQVVDVINQPNAGQPVPGQPAQRKVDTQPGGENGVQRMEDDEDIQMKPTGSQVGLAGGPVPTTTATEIQRARGGGKALEPYLQRTMGQAMGADFSSVKVHTDVQADRLNQTIQAKAFTTGSDVFFRQGEYNPGMRSGQELIAHELTHVVQQTDQSIQRQSNHLVQRTIYNEASETSDVKDGLKYAEVLQELKKRGVKETPKLQKLILKYLKSHEEISVQDLIEEFETGKRAAQDKFKSEQKKQKKPPLEKSAPKEVNVFYTEKEEKRVPVKEVIAKLRKAAIPDKIISGIFYKYEVHDSNHQSCTLNHLINTEGPKKWKKYKANKAQNLENPYTHLPEKERTKAFLDDDEYWAMQRKLDFFKDTGLHDDDAITAVVENYSPKEVEDLRESRRRQGLSPEEREKEDFDKRQIKKIEEYRTGDKFVAKDKTKKKELQKKHGSFRKAFKDKIKTINTNAQIAEGSIEQANNYIQGDASINAFFSQQFKKASSRKGSKGGITLADVNAHASKVYSKKFKAEVMPDGKLDGQKLNAYKDHSLYIARQSDKRVRETAADRLILEMYFNQVEKLAESKDDKKNKKEDIASIYKYAKSRAYDVNKRLEAQKKERSKLEDEGRISTTFSRGLQATDYAIRGGIVKVLTGGLLAVRKNRAKTGWVSEKDYNLDLETGLAEIEYFSDRKKKYNIRTPLDQIKDILKEFNAKWSSRKGSGINKWTTFFSALSLGLEAGKKFIGMIKSVLLTLTLICSAISSLAPVTAPIMGPIAAFLGTVTYWLGITQAGISALRIVLDGLAQLANNNPALFAELQGETRKSALNTGTELASLGGQVGLDFGTEAITNQDYGNLDAKTNPVKTLENKVELNQGPPLSLDQKIGKYGLQSTSVIKDGALAGINAGGTAIGSLDNNDMKFTQTVNKNRRIGKQKQGQTKATPEEMRFIKQSQRTTMNKAKKLGAKLVPSVSKLRQKPPKTELDSKASNKVPKDDLENMDRISDATDNTRKFAGSLIDGLNELKSLKEAKKNKD